MGQLFSILMVLGGETSKKQGDLDATVTLEVGVGGLRSSTSGVRYRPPNNDLDDVEMEDDGFTAQLTNTPVSGTATLETVSYTHLTLPTNREV